MRRFWKIAFRRKNCFMTAYPGTISRPPGFKGSKILPIGFVACWATNPMANCLTLRPPHLHQISILGHPTTWSMPWSAITRLCLRLSLDSGKFSSDKQCENNRDEDRSKSPSIRSSFLLLGIPCHYIVPECAVGYPGVAGHHYSSSHIPLPSVPIVVGCGVDRRVIRRLSIL